MINSSGNRLVHGRVTTVIISVVLLTVLAAPAAAQTARLAWSHPKVADVLSDGLVAFAVVQPCAWRDPGSWRWRWDGGCLGVEVGRILIAVAAAELTKRTTHHLRPDGSDDKSFFSEHTTITVAAGHWIEPKTLILGAAVAYLRMAANKHHPLDVGTGFGVGFAIRWGAQQR